MRGYFDSYTSFFVCEGQFRSLHVELHLNFVSLVEEEVLAVCNLNTVHQYSSATDISISLNVVRHCKIGNSSFVSTITVLFFLVFLGDEAKVNGIIWLLISIFDDFDFDGIFSFFREWSNSSGLFVSIVKERYLFSYNFIIIDDYFVRIIRIRFPFNL